MTPNRIEINQEYDLKKRLDIFIVEYLKNKYPRAKISSYIESGMVRVNQKVQKSSYKLKLNDLIEFDNDNLFEFLNPDETLRGWDFKLDIKYEDDDVIVINKPKNMLTHPTKFERENTLCNALINHCSTLSDKGESDRPGIVHRLDKNTSGLIVAAKSNLAYDKLTEQIRAKTAKRKYLAIALGEFEEQAGVIDKPLVHYLKDDVKMAIAKENEGLSAITHFKVLKQFKGMALVELELKTGRTHQIRVHLASINHPVFGDDLYGAKQFTRSEFRNIKTTGQLLQSYYLSFNHPVNERLIEIQLEEKDFSEDFIKVLKILRSKDEY